LKIKKEERSKGGWKRKEKTETICKEARRKRAGEKESKA
jgi:hypothetical protein